MIIMDFLFLALNSLAGGLGGLQVPTTPNAVPAEAADRIVGKIDHFVGLLTEEEKQTTDEQQSSLEEVAKGYMVGGSEVDNETATTLIADNIALPSKACECDNMRWADGKVLKGGERCRRASRGTTGVNPTILPGLPATVVPPHCASPASRPGWTVRHREGHQWQLCAAKACRVSSLDL